MQSKAGFQKRRGYLLTPPLLTLLAPSAIAQGTLQGKIVNGSQHGAPLAGQVVVLRVMKHGEEVKGTTLQTKTDSNGDFQFGKLEVDPHRQYSPSTVYQSIEYFGSPVAFTEKNPRALSNVIVYDTTTSDQALREEMTHVILDLGSGLLLVREIHLILNAGTQTYVGKEEASPGKKKTLHFILPNHASGVELGSGLMSCCAGIQGQTLYDTMELKPGMKQVAYSYQLKYKGSKATFALVPAYGAGVIDLFVPESPVKVESPLFGFAGTFRMKDRPYRRYLAQNLSRGQAVEIHLSNLPAGPRDLRWLAIVGLGLIALVAIALTLQRKGRPEQAVLPVLGEETQGAE